MRVLARFTVKKCTRLRETTFFCIFIWHENKKLMCKVSQHVEYRKYHLRSICSISVGKKCYIVRIIQCHSSSTNQRLSLDQEHQITTGYAITVCLTVFNLFPIALECVPLLRGHTRCRIMRNICPAYIVT